MKRLVRQLKNFVTSPIFAAFVMCISATALLVTGQFVLSFFGFLGAKVFLQSAQLKDLNERLREQEEMFDVLLADEDDCDAVYAREEII